MNYTAYPVDRSDPQGTFDRFLETLEPWLYIQVADDISLDETPVWTNRIRRKEIQEGRKTIAYGNLADIAALKNKLDRGFRGAHIYLPQHLEDGSFRVLSIKKGLRPPSEVPDEGSLIVLEHVTGALLKGSQPKWKEAIDSASEVRTLLYLYDLRARKR